MTSVPHLPAHLQAVLLEAAAPVARSSGFCRRRSKLTAACFVQTVVLGWWQTPHATLGQLCQMAALRGVAITPQGLDQRFTAEAATVLLVCLQAALGRTLSRTIAVPPLLARFSAVLVLDSTTIALPDALASIWAGCKGRVPHNTQSALKCSALLDLSQGSLVGLELGDGRTQDRATALQAMPVPREALRIADQGYWSLRVLAAIADGGGYFLSRYHPQTTVLREGVRLDLPRWLAMQEATVDVAVTLGLSGGLPARLLAIRVPSSVADARRRRIRAQARSGGHAVPARTLALADWTLLVTNVPATLLSVAEAEVLRRLRWQIELVFKLWKSHGQLDASRSAKPARILCELYAKLLAMVLQHGVLLLGEQPFGQWCLVQAAQAIRAMIGMLAVTLESLPLLQTTLDHIARVLTTIAPPPKRRKHPSAAQLLAAPHIAFA